MSARRVTITRSSAAATVVALGLGSAGGVSGEASQKVAVEDCSTRSQASFPGAFTDRRNLVVGPLAMIGAGKRKVDFFRDPGSDAGGQKFQLLVRNGHRVTVALSRRARRGAALAYGPLGAGQVDLADAHRVVKFTSCRRGERSGSSADGRHVTFWPGGVLARSPRCVPLRILIDGGTAPRRAVIHLGVRRCR